MTTDKLPLAQLETAARDAAKNSHSPYSKFPVGAAILTATGKIHTGCNIENASYSLTNCAERTAIQTTVAAGEKQIRCILIYTPTQTPTAPCGACRQVIREFAPDARIISICDTTRRIDTTLSQLLPQSFAPDNLP